MGEDGARKHSLAPVAAAVGKIDDSAGSGDRFVHVAERNEEFTEVAVGDSGVRPILAIHFIFGTYPKWIDGVGEAAQGAECGGRTGDDPGLGAGRQRRGGGCPRGLEEVGEQGQVRSERAENMRSEEHTSELQSPM